MFLFFCVSLQGGEKEKWPTQTDGSFFIPFCQTVFTPCLWTVALKTRQTLDTTHYEKQSLFNFLKQI